MPRSASLFRACLFGVLLMFLTFFPTTQLETYGQTAAQDLGFSDFSAFPETPTPDSFLTISLTIANFGTQPSSGFNITVEFERVGVGGVALESNQLTNPCATSTFCNIGIPGRQPILNSNGQATGAFTEPSTRQVLLSLNTTGLSEGLYQMTVRLDPTTLGSGASTGVTNDPIGSDHAVVIDLPIFSRPELSPSSVTFLPGSPAPFGSRVAVTATIANTGQREVSGSAQVDFVYCQQSTNEPPCEPESSSAFGATASRLLFLPTDFKAAGASASATTEATLDTGQLSRGLYRVGVRVRFSSTDASVFETDTNNNELTALLTIGGSAGGGFGAIRQLLVGQNQVGASLSPVFVSTQSNRLIIYDRAGLEALVTCAQLTLRVCSPELESQSRGFVTPFAGTDDVEGTVRLDVLGEAFKSFDEGFEDRQFIISDWQFSSNITLLAENPTEPIIYIGLANGTLVRINLETSLGVLSSLTAEQVVNSFGVIVRNDAEITAMLPLSNGVVLGLTDASTGIGRVYFLRDDRTSASLISSVSNMGRVHKFEATPGFLYIATENTLGGAPLFFITRIRTDSIDTIFRATSLQGLNGAFADFVVNRSSRLFIATNSDENATVFSYRLSPTQNTSSPLFDPWTSFVDPADNETAFNLTPVQTLALGDVTTNANGDEVLYIGTNNRLYTVETQRQFSSSGDLLWVINVGGNVASFAVNRRGTVDTGVSLLSTSDSTFNFVDGRNRSPTDQAPNVTIPIGETVSSTIFSEDVSFGDFIVTFRVLSIYGSDALYFTAVIP